MILRLTFHDNDFTSILEKFLDQPLFLGLRYCKKKYEKDDTELGIRKYVDLSKQIDEFLHMIQDEKKFNEEQEKDFLVILKESVLDYIKDTTEEDYDYLSEELQITIQKTVADKWENDEVVYYFPMHDRYITM